MGLHGVFGQRLAGDLSRQRDYMVRHDLVGRGIRNPRVLAAMARVPRELFVPPELVFEAYADRALPIGAGQTISQPYMVALMIEKLALTGGETVLEVGVGSGYASAVLARICNWVVGIERIPVLAEAAAARLQGLGCANVEIHIGDGRDGFPKGAPFDGILVSAAAPEPPPALLEQLAAGGRLVIPIGTEDGIQELITYRRGVKGATTGEPGLACRFVPLVAGTAGEGDLPEEPRPEEPAR